MTNEEILGAAIVKAVKNGWLQDDHALCLYDLIANTVVENGGIQIDPEYWVESVWSSYVLFDQSFAKAFWGEEEVQVLESAPIESCEIEAGKMCIMKINTSYSLPLWQYRLQQLAISEDRLQYLKDYLN